MSESFELNESDPGLIYRPSPQIVSDIVEGFSEDGNYHCVPDVSGMDVGEAGNRQQLTHRMINHILGDIEYPYGSTNRDDEFFDQLSRVEAQNGLPDAFDIVYGIFRDNYNGGAE